MKINKYFNQSTDVLSRKLNEINNILSNAKVEVSWFGKRVIRVTGYEGTVGINAVVQKVLWISDLRAKNNDLSLTERVLGIEIDEELKRLYPESENVLLRSNYLIKKLNSIREFTLSGYTPEFFIIYKLIIHDNFLSFTREKFHSEMWNSTVSGTRSNSLILGTRIIANIDEVKQQANRPSVA